MAKAFLTLYTKVTKDPISHNRDNVGEGLGFIRRLTVQIQAFGSRKSGTGWVKTPTLQQQVSSRSRDSTLAQGFAAWHPGPFFERVSWQTADSRPVTT